MTEHGGQRDAGPRRALLVLLAAPVALLRAVARAERAARRSPVGRWLTARRRLLLLACGLLLFVGGTVHLDRYPGIAQARADRAAVEQALDRRVPDPPAAGDGTAADGPADGPVVVGPAPGSDALAHARARADAIDRAPPGTDLAVVSWGARRTPGDAVELPAGVRPLALLVRLPDGRERRVDLPLGSDPAARVQQELAPELEELEREARELDALLSSGTVGDEDFEDEFVARLARLEAVLGDGTPGPVVHATVVSAELGDLRALAGSDGVRLVDPAPPGTDPDTARFAGIEPDAG